VTLGHFFDTPKVCFDLPGLSLRDSSGFFLSIYRKVLGTPVPDFWRLYLMAVRKSRSSTKPLPLNEDELTSQVVRRKGSTAGHEWDIISSYLDNQSEDDIGARLNITSKSVKDFIGRVAKSLGQSYETKKLISSQALDKMGKRYSWAPTKALDSKINSKFVSMLSEGDSPVLSEEELHFSYLLVYEGDQKAALVDSGLDVGLTKSLGLPEYNRLLELRCTYLKSKPNIISHL